MVQVNNLQKKFIDDNGPFDVLKDVTFTLEKGSINSLLGPSGAGKTTLLQIVGGLDNFDGGEVIVDNFNLKSLSMNELARFRNTKIGFVFQFHHLLADFTAIENVIVPGLILGKKKQECFEKAHKLLTILGLEKRETHFPSELSGGERQRVALARALYNDPVLVLADEPTGNLDKKNGEMLMEYVSQANKELGQTFLIATHNLALTNKTHTIFTLEDGVITTH